MQAALAIAEEDVGKLWEKLEPVVAEYVGQLFASVLDKAAKKCAENIAATNNPMRHLELKALEEVLILMKDAIEKLE